MMLVLTRKKGESIVINGDIEITVLDVQDDRIKLGLEAPKDVSIYRKEIFEILQENRNALQSADGDVEGLARLLKNPPGEGK